MIRSLDADVRSLLRSGVAVSSLTQCLDELVVNSLDAEASCVSIRVDIPSFRIQVIDNGCGVAKDDLELLGERYATSKCHSLEDLNELKSYGFRGEALASIRDIAGILEIVTRHQSSYKTYCKIFRNGKALRVTESCLPRSNVGTTVTAYEVFSSLPVRRKLVSDLFDFEKIRQRLASIALIKPNVSFSLYNEASGQKCLQTHKCQSVISTFSQLFGNLKAKSLREIGFEDRGFKVSGYIGLENNHNKNLQFLYVNGRLLLRTRIHKLVNQILRKSLLLKAKTAPFSDEGDMMTGQLKSPPKQGSDKYAIFVLNISCPLMVYDITLEPAKTLVEFEDWGGVLSCVQTCIESFLVKENLMLPVEQTEDMTGTSNNDGLAEDSSDSQVDLSDYEYQSNTADSNRYTQCISPSNIRKSLHSSVVYRKASQPSNLEDRSGSVSPVQEGCDEMELTASTEKSKTLATSLNSDEDLIDSYSSIIHPKPFVEIIKECEKNDNQTEKVPSTFVSLKLSPTIIPRQCDSLCSTALLLLQGSTTTRNKIPSRSCFTSPNPITLQCRRTSKRIHNSARTKIIDTSTSSHLILDRSKRVTSDVTGHANQTNCITTTTAQSSNISTRDTLNIHENSSQGSSDGDSSVEPDNPLRDLELLGDRCSSISSEGDRQFQEFRERTLDVIDILDCCTADKDFMDTSRIENTRTKQPPPRSTQDIVQYEDNCATTEVVASESKNSSGNSVGKVRSSSDDTESGDTIISKDGNGLGDNTEQGKEIGSRKACVGSREACVGSPVRSHDDKDDPLVHWQCTYDTNLQRKVYINLRTGNTSYDCPEGITDDAQLKDERSKLSDKETMTRGPLACAPHVSFDCTPWIPRKNRVKTTRTTQPECKVNDSLISQDVFDEKAMSRKSLGSSEGLVSLMFDDWDNPVFDSVPGMDIKRLSKPTKGRTEVRTHRAVYPYRFTKDMVKNMQVVRQVDDKFIVCRVRRSHEDENNDDDDSENDQDYLIVLLDQHAVHERIRLEKLIKDLYVSETTNPNQLRVKVSTVSPPIELEFSQQEFLLIKRFRSELQRVGVRFVIGSDCESSEPRVIVHELPSAFVDREVSETRRRRPSVAVSIVKELIQSHVEHMRQTNGVAPAIPKTILRVLSSQACHGAIKFGERLSVEECKRLIQELSICDLPFQCAHGRPSIVPLVDLQLLRKKELQLEAVSERPKLRRLTNAIINVS